MTKYTVFTRNWYKIVNGNIMPDPRARKTVIATVYDQDKAREICRQYNDTHKPGKLSRKAEYTSNY